MLIKMYGVSLLNIYLAELRWLTQQDEEILIYPSLYAIIYTLRTVIGWSRNSRVGPSHAPPDVRCRDWLWRTYSITRSWLDGCTVKTINPTSNQLLRGNEPLLRYGRLPQFSQNRRKYIWTNGLEVSCASHTTISHTDQKKEKMKTNKTGTKIWSRIRVEVYPPVVIFASLIKS